MSFAEELCEPPMLGRVVAHKYVLESVIGDGSCGTVYRARQRALGKHFAIKILHPAMNVDPTVVERFHREARAASQLNHPNSVTVSDFGQEPDGLLYLVMEYVEGRDLLTLMNEEGPLDALRIRVILGQVLAALAVAHDRGIVHRDLKPENILIAAGLDDDGGRTDVVKVCDFGIAALGASDDQRLTGRGLIVGTPEYIAPEQALGETIDGRTDLYALGAVLYQLLTHRVPFRASSPVETVIEQINARVTPPSQHCPRIDSVLESICLRALQKDRRARFDNAREMRAALRQFPSVAPPSPHRRNLITAAIGVVAVACAVGVIAANRGPARAEAAAVMITEPTAVSDSRELAVVRELPIATAAPPAPVVTAAPSPKPHPVAVKKPAPAPPAPAPEPKPTFIDDGF